MSILLTGPPGVGKTSLLKHLAENIENKCGFVTEELRESNGKGRSHRVGFTIQSLAGGERHLLASVEPMCGCAGQFRVGRYYCSTASLDATVIPQLEKTIRNHIAAKTPTRTKLFVMIDEIGSMEMKSTKFKRFLDYVRRKAKEHPTAITLVATIGLKFVSSFRDEVTDDLFVLSLENRDAKRSELSALLRPSPDNTAPDQPTD